MAQAAHCDKCGANVYVTNEGRCPEGHGPESLSNYYETDEPPVSAPSADDVVASATPAGDLPEDAPPPAASPAAAPPAVVPPAVVPPAVVPPAVVPPSAEPAATAPPATAPPAAEPPAGGIPVAPPPGESVSPAATAYAQASPGAPEAKKSKLGMIIGIVLVVLLLCGVGGTLATCALIRGAEDSMEELDAALEDATAEIEAEIEGETGEAPAAGDEPATGDENIALEAEAMVKHFYPDFTLVDYAEADTVGNATAYHILAQSLEYPDFYITFFIDRVPGGTVDDSTTQFDDDRAGVLWNHPQTRDHGLASFAGPAAIVPDTMRAGIMEAFGSAHPDMNVSKFSMDSNVKITLMGISDADLDAWYDDFTSFESVWESNLAEGTWEETSFTIE